MIDWFTFIAQIINFIILVFLLWRFLYKPITKTMGERLKRIERQWKEAQQKQEEAEAEAKSYRQKQQDLEQRREELLNEAKEKAKAEQETLIKQARQEVDRKQAEWHESIERQQDSFLENLRQRVQEQTHKISRRALQDLANAELEERAISVFIERLKHLEDEERKTFRQSVQESEEDVVINSAFDMSEETQQKLRDTLRQENIVNGNEIKFSTSSDLICGVEMRSKNHQIAWSLADYLENLEEQLSKEFLNKREPEAEAKGKAEDEQGKPNGKQDEQDKRKLLGLKEYKR
ncbi:F0F1 ATP synthase subunit delta [Coleofasciculus sp. E1-EBD-02]|uniref:F0F1 ATP synthase subunit delta n=1 Tax=Coleofasciculus sp. E1-EBD-02 TaxID=3068481 RepID=UPI003304E364